MVVSSLITLQTIGLGDRARRAAECPLIANAKADERRIPTIRSAASDD
jgi:hypothetical protein